MRKPPVILRGGVRGVSENWNISATGTALTDSIHGQNSPVNSSVLLILTHYEVDVIFVNVSTLCQVSRTLKSFSNMALGILFINYQISKGLVHFYMQLFIDG